MEMNESGTENESAQGKRPLKEGYAKVAANKRNATSYGQVCKPLCRASAAATKFCEAGTTKTGQDARRTVRRMVGGSDSVGTGSFQQDRVGLLTV